MKHLVSVIIPTYNRASTIKKSVDSVLNQTYKNIEIIIVDDASTDNTAEVLSQWYNDYENIIYVINDTNMGPSASRNIGVSYATGKYIAFHDSDDIWLPNKLEIQLNYIDKNPEFNIVYTPYILNKLDGTSQIIPSENIQRNNKEGDIFPTLLTQSLISPITLIMKKSIFYDAGGFNTSLHSSEDYEFSLRLAEKYPIGFIDEPLSVAFQSENGVDSQFSKQFYSHFYIVEEFVDYYIKYELLDARIASLLKNALLNNYINEFIEYTQTLTNPQIIDSINRVVKNLYH